MEGSHLFSTMEMRTYVVGPLEVNCYVIWDKRSREAVIIDPGGDGERLVKLIEGLDVTPGYLVNTHGHFDHVGANHVIARVFSPERVLHREDLELLRNAHLQAEYFGLTATPQPEPTLLAEDGMVVETGNITLELIHTPGHTPGSMSIYVETEGVLFSGDTLFQGSVGRTDLPGGSYDALISSIQEKLLPLGDEVRVFCGHGPPTTMGEERLSNPFIAGAWNGDTQG